jgi:8-amino-7-oxononanoate synthase
MTERHATSSVRTLRYLKPHTAVLVEQDGHNLINFSSNDYLGLSKHPHIIEGARAFISRYGAGSGSSRLISGNLDCYKEIEDRLAQLKGAGSSLVMSSGFQTNLTLLQALLKKDNLLFCDRLVHNSLLQGGLLSNARIIRFQHNDLEDLERRLFASRSPDWTNAANSNNWIVSESVFSMDGDQADINGLIKLARNHNCRLLIDEAHATGLFGATGMGLATELHNLDVSVGTFSKALGSFGGFVCCSEYTREYLINFCSGLIYSTGLPPSVLGARQR